LLLPMQKKRKHTFFITSHLSATKTETKENEKERDKLCVCVCVCVECF
jgi:hypothetical protein